MSVIQGIIGKDAEQGGITFYPYDRDEMTLNEFPLYRYAV